MQSASDATSLNRRLPAISRTPDLPLWGKESPAAPLLFQRCRPQAARRREEVEWALHLEERPSRPDAHSEQTEAGANMRWFWPW